MAIEEGPRPGESYNVWVQRMAAKERAEGTLGPPTPPPPPPERIGEGPRPGESYNVWVQRMAAEERAAPTPPLAVTMHPIPTTAIPYQPEPPSFQEREVAAQVATAEERLTALQTAHEEAPPGYEHETYAEYKKFYEEEYRPAYERYKELGEERGAQQWSEFSSELKATGLTEGEIKKIKVNFDHIQRTSRTEKEAQQRWEKYFDQWERTIEARHRAEVIAAERAKVKPAWAVVKESPIGKFPLVGEVVTGYVRAFDPIGKWAAERVVGRPIETVPAIVRYGVGETRLLPRPTPLEVGGEWLAYYSLGMGVGRVAGVAFKGISPIVSKAPGIGRLGAAIAARPTAFKAVTLGAIGGIETLKAKQMYEAGVPVEEITRQVGKDVAFIAGFGIGFRAAGKRVAKDTVKVRLADKPELVSKKVSVVKGKQVMTETWKFKPGKQVYEIPKSLYGKMRIHPGRVFEITTQRPITTAEWTTFSGRKVGERITGEIQRSVLYAEFPKRVPSRVWWKALRVKPHKWARDYRVVVRGAPRGISITREQVFKVPPTTVEFIKQYVPRTLEPGVKKLIYRIPPSFKMPAEISRVPSLTITGMEVGKKAVKISKKIVFGLGVGGGVTRQLTKTPLGLLAIAPTPTMVPFPVTAISLSAAGATMGAVGLATIQQTQEQQLKASQMRQRSKQRFGLQQAQISTQLRTQAWGLSQRQAQALAQTQTQMQAQATAQLQQLTLQYPKIAPSIVRAPTVFPVIPAWMRREREKPPVRERPPARPSWKYKLLIHPLGDIMELVYGRPKKKGRRRK